MTGYPFRRNRRTTARGGRGVSRAAAALAAAVAIIAAGLAAPPAVQAASRPGPAKPLPVPAQKLVPVHPVPANKIPVIPEIAPPKAVPPRWPAAGSAVISVGAEAGGAPADEALPGSKGLSPVLPGPGAVRAGGLPVWAGPAAASGTAPKEDRVTVTVAPHATALADGVPGVVFSVGETAAGPAARLRISLSYRSFASAYGGNYASRLHLVELPGCALTDPASVACRRQVPLGSAVDLAGGMVGADVTVPAVAPPGLARAGGAAAPPAAVVLAATTSPSSSEGDWSATPLPPSGNWAQGGASGAFTYSYPVQVPPVPGGLVPGVSLDYDSQAADGMTSATNDQASWAGDGWDYSPGYIERDYPSCATKPTGATDWVVSADLCMSSTETTTMSFGGATTTLVPTTSSSASWQATAATSWRAEADGNEQVQYLTGAGNGSHGGGYWVITKPDGTKYYYGESELPGWATGDTATGSAWSVPVYQYQSGEPCYSATAADAKCSLPWRWNLDYVVDPHGDAMAYFYQQADNYYANMNSGTGSAEYQAGGDLTSIEYGLRAGAIYGSTAGTLVTPAGKVVFGIGTGRTDIPTDLACGSAAACGVAAPTFWSKGELDSITAYALEGKTPALAETDTWALGHANNATDPDPAETAPLWLSSITRTGKDGGTIALPPVIFDGQYLANRVEPSSGDSYPTVSRERLVKVTTETGGVIGVGYDTPPGACSGTGTLPAEDANTGLCYPDWWTPTTATGLVESWFNKYVVTSVTQQNTTGGAVPVITTYCYGGAGAAGSAGCLSGGAWHYDDDTVTRSQNRTWDQWRGFGEVTAEKGTAPDPVTETQDTYFQGMSGDHQSDGSTPAVTLTDSRGDRATDSDQFAGLNFEHVVCDGAAADAADGFCGNEVTDTVTIPWTSTATASVGQPTPLPALQSFLTGTAETDTYRPGLSSGGTRESTVTYAHDSYGRVTSASAVPDTSDAKEDTCTTTSYADNAGSWILDLPAEVTTVSVPCGSTVTLPGDAISDVQTFYDSSTTLGAMPSTGNVTETAKATAYTGSTPTYTVESKATYDEYGRVLTAADADGRTTTTSYSPLASGEEPATVTVDDPTTQNGTTATTAELATTTTYDPARYLPLTVTDPAGYVTTKTYDALGRLTGAWKPGDPATGPATEKFSYPPSGKPPTLATSQTLNDAGGYQTDETLYDSLGRLLETQDETADGKSTISDVYYNSDGWKQLVSNPYTAGVAPSGTLLATPTNEVPSSTGYSYDGDGRVTEQTDYKMATETRETDTAYGGDYTTVTYQNKVAGEPDGGTPETTFTNGKGETSAIWQYHAGAAASVTDNPGDYDKTTYTYTPAGQRAGTTDAAGDTWAYHYDLAGDQTSAADPDTGTTSSTYDPAGQLSTSTDARGKQLTYVYDADGRKTAEYDITSTTAKSVSNEIAAWSYDTLKKGLLTSSSTYYSGHAYTQQVTGYDGFGQPDGQVTTIPTAFGGNLTGSWEQDYAYNNYTGDKTAYQDAADGGLPAEDVSIGYNAADEPDALTSPAWNYVASLSYTELGQPLEYTMGTTATPAWIVDAYDQETGALSSSTMQAGGTPVTVDATAYAYDNVGNVTQEADTPAGGPAQVQCFGYDYLDRLSTAWSQSGTGCPASASQAAEAGAAAPYQDQYSYDTAGDLTQVTSTPASGQPTVTSTAFNGPGAAGEPAHGISTQTVTPPSGTATTHQYGYDASGDLQSVSSSSAAADSLSWDDAGRLAQATTPTGTVTYLYDAAGHLLLQEDAPSQSSQDPTTTLYLPDEQIVADNSKDIPGA